MNKQEIRARIPGFQVGGGGADELVADCVARGQGYGKATARPEQPGRRRARSDGTGPGCLIPEFQPG